MNAAEPLLSVNGLAKHFPSPAGLFGRARGAVKAVDGVSFTVARGEALGLVGESGSGKTTVGRMILRLMEPTHGTIRFDGVDVTRLSARAMRPHRRRMQIIFQDPFASLNPRMRAEDVIGEPLIIHRIGSRSERRARVAALLEKVGLSTHHMRRYPHEFSGGQRQRLGIARALAAEPDFLVADEPVSALDPSIRAQVINLLEDLQRELRLAMVFIAHDLSVVEHVSDRVAVMYLGRIMEIGPARAVYARPRHPYTEALLSAAPVPDPDAQRKKIILKGDIPSPADPPSGCVFRTRCPYAIPECSQTVPPPVAVGPEHNSACVRTELL